MKKYTLIIFYILLCGCINFPSIAKYTDPISYDVEIGKTTKEEIINTFGIGESYTRFSGNSISSRMVYGCGNNSALTLCVIKNGKKICTPCGVPVDNHYPYDGVSFDFTDDILNNVGYFTGKYNHHPMISQEWINRAPKENVGNYNTLKITR